MSVKHYREPALTKKDVDYLHISQEASIKDPV